MNLNPGFTQIHRGELEVFGIAPDLDLFNFQVGPMRGRGNAETWPGRRSARAALSWSSCAWPATRLGPHGARGPRRGGRGRSMVVARRDPRRQVGVGAGEGAADGGARGRSSPNASSPGCSLADGRAHDLAGGSGLAGTLP